MRDFFIRLGGKRCQHKDLLDISKYRSDNYYQDLLGKYDEMPSVEQPVIEEEDQYEQEDQEDKNDEDNYMGEQIEVVHKKGKSMKTSVHPGDALEDSDLNKGKKKRRGVLEMDESI